MPRAAQMFRDPRSTKSESTKLESTTTEMLHEPLEPAERLLSSRLSLQAALHALNAGIIRQVSIHGASIAESDGRIRRQRS
jgi:hypothetical protein